METEALNDIDGISNWICDDDKKIVWCNIFIFHSLAKLYLKAGSCKVNLEISYFVLL